MSLNGKDIFEHAKKYLTSGWRDTKGTLPWPSKVSPELVFDHSVRVFHLSKVLLKDAAALDHKVDETVLSASALFHDAGWVERVKAGHILPTEIFSRPADEELFKSSARVVTDQMGDLLDRRRLEKVVQIITEIRNPRRATFDAVLLSDADNLEDFGLLGVIAQIRIGLTVGKSPRQIIESWDRQKEYHYWEARIKKALHLESSKKIASQRLERMGKIFDLLQYEIELKDFEEMNSDASLRDVLDTIAG